MGITQFLSPGTFSCDLEHIQEHIQEELKHISRALKRNGYRQVQEPKTTDCQVSYTQSQPLRIRLQWPSLT